MPNDVASRLRQRRLAAGFTMRELAKNALGRESNARLISSWESGAVMPSLPSLRKVATALNISVIELIDDSTITLPSQSSPKKQTRKRSTK